MNDFEGNNLNAIEARLKLVIDAIVMRHRVAGDALTWRLLHAIEDEAFEQLTCLHGFQSTCLGMMKSSGIMQYPRTDDLADFGESNVLPAAFFLIEQAFKRIDA